ncbi:MAG: hypothetical protein Q4C30_06130 [Bacteroidia bacterium]|nr:hypothetical protein [Bacteroidia bacterium]
MLKYLLIRNCRLLEPEYGDQLVDVLACEDRVIEIGNSIIQPSIDTVCIEAEGRVLLPSLVDIKTNLSVPTPYDTGTHQTLQTLVSMGIGTALVNVKQNQIQSEYVSLTRQEIPTINYGCHFTLTSLVNADKREIIKYKTEYGIPTSYHKLISNGRGNREKLLNAINIARELGLRMIFDIEKDGSTIEHLHVLGDLCNELAKEPDNDVLFVGIKYKEEVDFIEQLKQNCNVRMQLSFSTTDSKNKQLHPIDLDSLVQYVRSYSWCSIGIIDMGIRMRTFQSDKIQTDNHWYNTLSLLTSLSSDNPITLHEAVVAVVQRNAEFCGIGFKNARVAVGAPANFILWNESKRISVGISSEDGTLDSLVIKGCIDYSILNGHIIYSISEGINETSIKGRNIYRRIQTKNKNA